MSLPPPPDERSARRAVRWLSPLEKAFRTEISGVERIPRGPGPLMFVGNHQLLAFDSPFLVAQLWRAYGVPVRPLVDDWMFGVKPLGRWLQSFGVVRATRENAHALLRQDAWILVYPGGAREAIKSDSQPYELCWWDRLGFADVALQHRATIVPIAARGIDGAFDILLSADQLVRSPLGKLIDLLHIRHDMLLPLAVPRRWPHLRFRLCEPVVLDHFLGGDRDTQKRRLRGEVARALAQGLEELAWHPEQAG